MALMGYQKIPNNNTSTEFIAGSSLNNEKCLSDSKKADAPPPWPNLLNTPATAPIAEWIKIESTTENENESSGAEWETVNFSVPPKTPKAVVEFIIDRLNPYDGMSVNEYDISSGKGDFINMGSPIEPGSYDLRVTLCRQDL